MADESKQLEELIVQLDRLAAKTTAEGGHATTATAGAAGPHDAIDAELGRPGRSTAVTSVRHHAAVEAFRRELTDGLIRADTANKLLGLVGQVLQRVLSA